MEKENQKKPGCLGVGIAVLIVFAIIGTYPWLLLIIALAAVAIFVVVKRKKQTPVEPTAAPVIDDNAKAPDDAVSVPNIEPEHNTTASIAVQTPSAPAKPEFTITAYEVKGVFKHEKEIFHNLMELNPAYDWTKKELIDECMTGYPVYKWVPKEVEAKLVPEPDNPYDKNAIQVIVGECLIGYIPREKCLEVQKILDEGRLINVAYEITGGKYKLIEEDYDPLTDKSHYDMESGYEEVSAKIHIKERLS